MKTFLNNMKEGFVDAQNMLLEGNYKPFLAPVIIVVALYFGIGYLNDNANQKVSDVRNRVEAQKAEIANEQEYKLSKKKYDSLVVLLPPNDRKNEWLLGEMLAIFEQNKIVPTRTGKHNLEDTDIFTLSSVTYDFELDFMELGKLVESIENSEKFLRISELLMTKMEGGLGRIKTTMRVNTIFINENRAVAGAKKGGK